MDFIDTKRKQVSEFLGNVCSYPKGGPLFQDKASLFASLHGHITETVIMLLIQRGGGMDILSVEVRQLRKDRLLNRLG